jgi:phosphatidylglycerophosphate synthase
MSLKQWNIIHSIAILIALAVFHVTGIYWPILAVAFLSLILLWTSQWYTISNLKPAGGYANYVTLLRYILLLLIAAFSNIWPMWSLGLLFAIPMLLDGLDGYLARRLNHATRFGALFDLETDSLFVTLSGMILYQRHIVGIWLLPAAYMRYFYVLVIAVLQLNRIQEKRTQFGPFIAGIMFVSLILEFLFQSALTRIILFIASVFIVLSFIYSFFGVMAQRRNA